MAYTSSAMKSKIQATVIFIAFISTVVSAQQFPTSQGTCRVSPSGVEGCAWSSKLRPVGGRNIIATTYILAAGAPVETGVKGQDAVLVAMTDGRFINEITSPQSTFSMAAGNVVLMPGNQRYKIRNVGDKPATVLVVQLRPYSTKAAFGKAASTQIDPRDSCDVGATEVLNTVSEIKLGDPRSKVELNFEEDGGMQFPPQTRYLWKDCKYVKIEVEFSRAGASDWLHFLPTDKVVKVSKPYLELPDKD